MIVSNDCSLQSLRKLIIESSYNSNKSTNSIIYIFYEETNIQLFTIFSSVFR